MRNYYLIIMIFLVATGCKKKQSIDTNQLGNNSISFDFTYSGKQWAYQPINFETDLPDSVFRSWDYGDSTPIYHLLHDPHTYTKDGTYTITLTANGKSVSKTITIGFGIERILKYKKWHRTVYYRLYFPYVPPYLLMLDTPKDVEQKNLSMELNIQVTQPLYSSFPYSLLIPGNDTTSNHVFKQTEMKLVKLTDSMWTFAGEAMDPSVGANSCTYYINKDYVEISRLEYYFPASGSGYYYATYTSY